jgi:hypothetical protein
VSVVNTRTVGLLIAHACFLPMTFQWSNIIDVFS